MRFVAIGNFLFGVGIFFLPWIDVRCEMGAQQSKSIVEQSGYQIAQGEVSEGQALKDPVEMGNARGGNVQQQKDEIVKDLTPEPAPLAWGFVGMLGAGAVLSLVIPGKAWRAGAILGALGAAGVLGVLTAQGFPLEKKANAVVQKEKDQMPKANGPAAPKIDFGPVAPKILTMTYKPGFFLAWALAVLPLLWVLIDSMMAPPFKRDREYDTYRSEDDDRRRRDDDYDDRRRRRDDD